MNAPAAPLSVDPPPAAAGVAAAGGLRWVLDPDDDQACLHQLVAMHDLAAGRVVCHPTRARPGRS